MSFKLGRQFIIEFFVGFVEILYILKAINKLNVSVTVTVISKGKGIIGTF